MIKSRKSIVFIVFAVNAIALVLLIQFDIKTVFSKKNYAGESQLFLSNEKNLILSKRDLGKKEKEFMPGEAIVKFKNETLGDRVLDSEVLSGALTIKNHKILSSIFNEFRIDKTEKIFSNPRNRVMKLISKDLQNDPEKTEKMVEALSRLDEVEYADLNYIFHPQMVPNDTYYSSFGAWGQSFRDLWGLQKISIESAWDTTQGSGIVVAITDTGVDYAHEELAANIWNNSGETGTDAQSRDKKTNGVDDDANGYVDDWRGWDFTTCTMVGFACVPKSADNDPQDDHGHGTHVAGTVAAVGNNSKGIIGVAPQVKIMPVKGLGAGGGTLTDLINTIYYAANNGAKVINASWGVRFPSKAPQSLIDAINYATDVKGAVFVAAAGNSYDDVGDENNGYFPASIKKAIVVAASDETDTKANFSNYGERIDVIAPGGGSVDATDQISFARYSILSLISANYSEKIPTEAIISAGYARLGGTSMAAPHVSGVAALILSLSPSFSPEQVRQALRAGADDLGVPGFDAYTGYGRLNASKALNVASPMNVEFTSVSLRNVNDIPKIEIKGTASGPNFSGWRLEYGYGDSPLEWVVLASSASPITNGLFLDWDVSSVRGGSVAIRLIALNSLSQAYERRTMVSIPKIITDQFFITEPTANPITVHRSGQVVAIKGTVTPSNLHHYAVSIRKSDSTMMSDAKIQLVNGGVQRISNDTLALWDTAGALADHYRIIFEVVLTDGTVAQEIIPLIVDPTIQAGWPLRMGKVAGGLDNLALADALNTADIDKDGDQDIIIGYGKTVRIFDHSGAQVSGWPQSIDLNNTGAVTQITPVVGDLTGDHSLEVVAGNSDGQIFIWDARGILLPGWPKNVGGGVNFISVDDLDGDGTEEVIATSLDGKIKVFDKDGVNLRGWPRFFGSLSQVATGDTDGDGRKEVAFVSSGTPTVLYLLRYNGEVASGWPQNVPVASTDEAPFNSYPVMGDLDANGDLEIIIGASDGRVYAFNHDGTAAAGWPQKTKELVIKGRVVETAIVNSPAIGDINGDGKVDVVAGIQSWKEGGSFGNYLFAWSGSGVLLKGWPVKYDRPTDVQYFGFGAPAIADINDDGKADVIASSDGGAVRPFVLNAYNYSGAKINGFPKPTLQLGAYPTNTPAVSDVDGDGLMELVWVDFDANLYLWDLESPITTVTPWPMFHATARHTGALIDVIPPNISLTAPKNGIVTLNTETISVDASDNIGISRVEFYADNTVLIGKDALPPYSIEWNVLSDFKKGTKHTLTAKAIDYSGGIRTTSPITITTSDAVLPKVSISSPVKGYKVAEKSKVALKANATDNIKIAKVEFYVSGNLLCTDEAAPYSCDWDVFDIKKSYQIKAIAYDIHENATSSRVLILPLRPDSGVVTTPKDVLKPLIRILNSSGRLVREFLAYEDYFKNGISLTVEDLGTDGVREIVTAPNRGRKPEVRIFSLEGKRIDQFLPYSANYLGGVNVAVGDLDGDRSSEIITVPQAGAPQLKVFGFRKRKWKMIMPSVMVYSKSMKSGVNVVAADLDGDRRDEVVVIPEAGGRSEIKIYGLRNGKLKLLTPQITVWSKKFLGGGNLAAADLNGDGKEEVLVSIASRGGPQIKILGINTLGRYSFIRPGFFAFDKDMKNGIDIAAIDIDGDGNDEIAASMAGDGKPMIRIFKADGSKKLKEFSGLKEIAAFGISIDRW